MTPEVTAQRLVCVTRRFWPLVGGAERFMGEFAVSAHGLGRNVTLLTARWDRRWPQRLTYRDLPVIRLPQPKLRFVGTLVYMASLSRWLRRHLRQFDLVFVSLLKHDAAAAIWAVGKHRPVVLIAEGSGSTGDCAWQQEAFLGRWIRRVCYRADAVIAPSREIEAELWQAGYPRDRVHFLPHGVDLPPPRTPELQRTARQALATANPLMRATEEERLAVFVGRLHPGKGLAELIDAWPQVLAQHPRSKLWLVGDGPMEDELRRRVNQLGLSHYVVLAGRFDDVREVLAAADLFVFPSHQEGMSLALLEAMAAGLPIVASDIPGNRAILEAEQEAVFVPVGDADALAAGIGRVLSEPGRAEELGARARARVERQFCLEKTVADHLALFDQLVADRQIARQASQSSRR